jgi:glycosyltransferase involved in cell wall biosynthesis
VPGDKIVVIRNGANTDMFQPMDISVARKKLNLNQSGNYICFVGAFSAWHRIDRLVRSVPLVLQDYPNTRFLIIGDGKMKQDLIILAEQIGVHDKIIFTGRVPYQEVPLYINASDVCVFPSTKNFRNNRTGGSPLKLYEYMACGKPVVVGNVAGVSDDVTDANSGFVVDTANNDEMARAIIKLLSNEQLRKEMGDRGRKAAVEKHSWRKVAEQLAEVFESVIQKKEII